MTRTELLSLADALASDVAVLLREGLPQEALRADAAQALLRKLAELRPVAWRDRECWQDIYTLGKPTHTTSEPLYQLSEVLTDD